MAVVLKLVRKELILVERSRIWIFYCEGYTPTQIFDKTKHPRYDLIIYLTRDPYTYYNLLKQAKKRGS